MNDLLEEILQFQSEVELSDHRVGILLAKNGRLLPRLREGRRMWPETIAEIRENLGRERRERGFSPEGKSSGWEECAA